MFDLQGLLVLLIRGVSVSRRARAVRCHRMNNAEGVRDVAAPIDQPPIPPHKDERPRDAEQRTGTWWMVDQEVWKEQGAVITGEK